MLETAFAQLRLAPSIMFGNPFSVRSLDRLVNAMIETRREFGSLGSEAGELINGPAFDEEARRELHLHHFCKQAVRATRETSYYQALFERLGLDPKELSYEEISQIPLTSQTALRDNPHAFVSCKAKPYLRTMTGGTAGWPTSIYFSEYELKVMVALGAFALLLRGDIGPEDLVQIHYPVRATHLNIGMGDAFARLGALVHRLDQIEPKYSLALLAEKHKLKGKKPQVSVMLTYPSYLGAVVEYGLQTAYHPSDFGLERVVLAGELVTEGLKTRVRKLFGPIEFIEHYTLTEMYPFCGVSCTQGHLHFEASHGLPEVIDLESGASALSIA
ncbi:MAG: hypothetical protein GWN30_31560 [Gammaproteobacteria bacterium]|nr:hypothetical protein [Gammaproteobacteria bacterium]NIX00362.1 hypothetical protein [Phycisphaerae bacterium]